MDFGLSLQGTLGTVQYAGGPSEKLIAGGGKESVDLGPWSLMPASYTGQFAGGKEYTIQVGCTWLTLDLVTYACQMYWAVCG